MGSVYEHDENVQIKQRGAARPQTSEDKHKCTYLPHRLLSRTKSAQFSS